MKVKPVALDKTVEWLKYEFTSQTENSATIALQWEKLSIPFKVEVDYVKTQLQAFRRELRDQRSFSQGWRPYQQAAQFTINRNVDLEEGLQWADQAVSGAVGQANFTTLSTKASVLSKMNRDKEADSIMKQALPLGSMPELHAYGRQLLQQKRIKDALEVFQMNFKKNPNQFTTLMGLVRGYSANADYKNALKYAQMALPLAPPGANKTNVENMIDKLKKGEDVN